ncbi:MAG TPA: tetratricopeptide repeat protein, partial [Rubrobacter sp.]|nr:tetratricopeptide repeat protein [Rubrobacter sp.]
MATTRTNLGILYASLGENRMALENYHLALGLLEQQPESRQKAVILSKLGDVLIESEGPEAALEKYQEALALRRRLQDTRGQAVTLNSMGLAHLEAKRPMRAFRDFGAAVEILSAHQEPVDQSMVLSNLALAYERLDRPERARELYQQALALGAQDRRTSGVALFGLARVARMERKLDEAERRVEQSLESVEAIRGQVWRPDLRSTYHAAQQEQYAFLIDLLAERHRLEPERGHAARAFAVAERARARSLLDLVSAARHRPDPEELRRLDHLSQQINSHHRKWLSASSRGIANDGVERELTTLLERWRQEKVAAEGPRRPENGARPTLSLEQVQARLLDERTLFLEYFLGEEKSYLWAVTSSTVRLVDTLPGRRQIEQAALQVHERMAVSHQQTDEVAARQAAAKLSGMILGPVADLLHRQRLVIVAPGLLQTVPFAALPRPDVAQDLPFSEQRPLIVDHEIVSL